MPSGGCPGLSPFVRGVPVRGGAAEAEDTMCRYTTSAQALVTSIEVWSLIREVRFYVNVLK